MSSVFLSHSSRDADVVRSLSTQLNRLGVWTWVDAAELRPGSRLMREISNGVQDVSVFALILSHDAAGSAWVRREFEWARDLRIKQQIRSIAIVTLGGMTPKELPDWVQADLVVQYIAAPRPANRDWVAGFAGYLTGDQQFLHLPGAAPTSVGGVKKLPGKQLFGTKVKIPKAIRKLPCYSCAYLVFTAHPHSGESAALAAEGYAIVGNDPFPSPLCRHPDNTRLTGDYINGKVVESLELGPKLNPDGKCQLHRDRVCIEGHPLRVPPLAEAPRVIVSGDSADAAKLSDRLGKYSDLVSSERRGAAEILGPAQSLSGREHPNNCTICMVIDKATPASTIKSIINLASDISSIVIPVFATEPPLSSLGFDTLWLRADSETSAKLATRDIVEMALSPKGQRYLHKLTQPSMVFNNVGLRVTGFDFVTARDLDTERSVCGQCENHEYIDNPNDERNLDPDLRAFSQSRSKVAAYLRCAHYNQVCRASRSYSPNAGPRNQSASCVFKNLDGACSDFSPFIV